jgi:hypothetical protein
MGSLDSPYLCQPRVYAHNLYICDFPLLTIRGVATLCIKNTGVLTLRYNDSGESINNRKYLLEFDVDFEKPSDTKKGAWKESISEKIRDKKTR